MRKYILILVLFTVVVTNGQDRATKAHKIRITKQHKVRVIKTEKKTITLNLKLYLEGSYKKK